MTLIISIVLLLIKSVSSNRVICPGEEEYFYENNIVTQVCEGNFREFLSNHNDVPTVIEFYAPWCGHCQHLKPTYAKLAEKMKGKMVFGAADCTNARSLCGRYDVAGYPTLRIFPRNSDGSRSSKYSHSRSSVETMETYLMNTFYGENSLFEDTHRPPGQQQKQRTQQQFDDPDVAVHFVDVDITTLIRIGVFAMYLGNAISLFSVNYLTKKSAHAISREFFQCPFYVALVFAFHMTIAVVSLIRPCSLITTMAVAWGYYESLLFIDESASNFLVRAPFWLMPLSLLWLQIRGGTADFCTEESQSISKEVVSVLSEFLGIENVEPGWISMLWFVLVLFVLFVIFGESMRFLFGKKRNMGL